MIHSAWLPQPRRNHKPVCSKVSEHCLYPDCAHHVRHWGHGGSDRVHQWGDIHHLQNPQWGNQATGNRRQRLFHPFENVKIWKCFIGKWERCIQMKMIIHWVVQYQYEMTVIDIHAMHFNSLYSNKSFKQDIIAARVEISFWISETLFLNGTIYNTWALVAPFLFI